MPRQPRGKRSTTADGDVQVIAKNRPNRVRDENMIMELRVECPTGAMAVPDTEHTLGVDDRSTGVTGAGVRDPQ